MNNLLSLSSVMVNQRSRHELATSSACLCTPQSVTKQELLQGGQMFVLQQVSVLCRWVCVCACRSQLQSSLGAVKKAGVEGSDLPRHALNNPVSSRGSSASRAEQLLAAPVLQRLRLAVRVSQPFILCRWPVDA